MSIKVKQANLGATLSEATAKQFTEGPGELLGLAVDYAAAANAATTITMYDGRSTAGPVVYTAASVNTDFGTTVPVRLFTNGRLVAGTSTNNVKAGIPFFDGLYVAVTGDVAGPQSIRAWFRPLVRKDGNITTTGSAGSAAGGTTLFGGAGILKAARVIYDPDSPAATTDVLLYDGISTSGRTLLTVTDSATHWTANANSNVVTTTGHDEAATGVTTAANAHENDGILFYTGIHAAVAGSNAFSRAASVSILVEA